MDVRKIGRDCMIYFALWGRKEEGLLNNKKLWVTFHARKKLLVYFKESIVTMNSRETVSPICAG